MSFVRNIFICSIECKVNDAADGTVCRNFCFFEPGISTERKDQIGEEIKKKKILPRCGMYLLKKHGKAIRRMYFKEMKSF